MTSIPLVLLWQTLAGLILAGACLLWWRRRRSATAILLVAAAFALNLIAPMRWQPDSGSAQRTLRVLSVLDAETTQALVRGFAAHADVRVEVDPFEGGARGAAELLRDGRVQPDVLLGGTSEIHDLLRTAGASRPVPLVERTGADRGRVRAYDDPEGHYVPIYVGTLALVTRPLAEFAAHPPDWNTLIEPVWSGRVSLPSPASTSGGLVFLAIQVQRQPEAERAWKYLQLLNEREVTWESRSDDVISRVASGRADLGVSWAHDAWRRRERERIPIEVFLPSRTGFEVGAVSVLRWARDPEVALDFATWLVSAEAQEIQVRHGLRAPVRTDVAAPPYLRELGAPDSRQLGFYDRERVLAQRDAWLARWRELTQAEATRDP